MKARSVLEQMRRVPKMFASNKEAFCATVVTAFWMEEVKGFHGGKFYKRHMNGPGNTIVGCNDPFNDKWARAVIDDAMSILKDSKKPCPHLTEYHKQYEEAEAAGLEPKPCVCGSFH